MPRRPKVLFSLARKRVRPSLKKENIYNAFTWSKNRVLNSQYRQVFFAKQETRSYHGEHLTETQFRNVFRSELTSVSPLQSRAQKNQAEDEIPHALQTYVSLERRLDFAVFRALFASSVRQAAQFVVGGAVQVNGVKIKQPGYTLRAGDVFSVDPNRVLEALGRQKPSLAETITINNRIIKKYNSYLDMCRNEPEKMFKLRAKRRRRHFLYNQKYLAREEERVNTHNRSLKKEMDNNMDAVAPKSILESVLRGDLETANQLVTGKAKAIQGLVKTSYPTFVPDKAESVASEYYSQGGPPKSDVKRLVSEIVEIQREQIRADAMARMRSVGQPEVYDPKWVDRLPEKIPEISSEATLEEVSALVMKLPFSTTGKVYGLADPSKRWFTPWTPRQFIAPMAVLPHHLEVSFETCHAVYLRDPVARPGHSEVISPFALDMHERAHMWYFFRRRKNLPSPA